MPTSIHDPFWSPRLQVNAEKAIFHQWQQLEASGCIENFRLTAGEKDGVHEGWFFADSDAYKWLDAAARIYPSLVTRNSSLATRLHAMIDDFLALLSRAQCSDGYIYTYNQLNFPNSRWENLMIEHELYCHGHLIEGCVSHHEATGEETALRIARKAADMLVREFLEAGPDCTSGHEEIEIALLRLYQVTSNKDYLDLAAAFLERRGRVHPFARLLIPQNARVEKRKKLAQQRRDSYRSEHPEHAAFHLPPGNYAVAPGNSRLRWVMNALSGKYFQMHRPIRKQTVPVGHAVRFGYLETATAMLMRLTGDCSLLPAMQAAWERMVTRFMYVSGGLGAVPGLEGFGRDDELDPLYAYAETCAALASMFWNWEMVQVTGEAKYGDLFEWQLYNAAGPGMGLQGDTYLYNNPLTCHGGVERRAWFAVPCCPSNLSRTWASLGKYISSSAENNVWVHQYIGSEIRDDSQRAVRIESALPWEGKVKVTFTLERPTEFTLHLRIPSWAGRTSIQVNDEDQLVPCNSSLVTRNFSTASGYDPRTSIFLPITRTWYSGDTMDLDFEMPILFRRADRRVRGHRGKIAVTRGPLVYCLESVDNPGIDIFDMKMDLAHEPAITYHPALLGGTQIIKMKTKEAQDLTFIPYQLWANRVPSKMTVWVNT